MKRLHPGMTACLADGGTTLVTDVLRDAQSGDDRYVVLSAHGYFGTDVVAPTTAVWCIDERAHLSLTAHEVGALPPYTPVTYCREHGLCSVAAAQRGPGWRHRTRAAEPAQPLDRQGR